ncbi:MAG TPA: hypothetical protein VMM78_05035 [Thermomicrobiales bacterium]|nr:hypothetical protein [Thermomicrobiales bacterium]
MPLIRRRRKPEGPLTALRDIDWDTRLRDSSGDTSSLSFFSGFVLGTCVGVIVAILLAPERE